MHLGLLDAMPKTGIQRRRIMDFIYSLRDYPYTAGDFTDKDASLRTRVRSSSSAIMQLLTGSTAQLTQ